MADTASPPALSDQSTIAASTLKHKKRSSGGDDDRISRLPDAVICHILSFIPTKYAVGTSVLSKRWKFVWTSVPNLEFDDCSLFNRANSVSVSSSFLNFVDRVLSLHSSSFTRTFRIRCNKDYPLSRAEEWIGATITRDIVNLDLQFSASHRVSDIDQSLSVKSLPEAFFNRKNLVSLRLVNIALKVPTGVKFPSVRKMLLSVQLLDDDSLKNLLSGSPVLKALFMDRTTWYNADTLCVCSSTLDELIILTSHFYDKDSGYKVVIEAPSLRYLYLNDDVDYDYDMVNISSLEKLSLRLRRTTIRRTTIVSFKDRLFRIFRKASHIKDLTLSCYILQSLGGAHFEHLPMFNHLTHLSVEFDCLALSWSMLMHLLEYSPNLVNFVMDTVYGHEDGFFFDNDIVGIMHPPNFVPECLSSSLQNIVIIGLGDDDESGEMIKYFLKSAMVLKELSISFRDVDMLLNSRH